MFNTTIHTLSLLKRVLATLPIETYTMPCRCLSGATLGQHTRHLIELYQCLLKSYEEGIVNYDCRPRNTQIETDSKEAVRALTEIQKSIQKPDKEVLLVNQLEEECINVKSTYYREVLYNLEHTIHHEALLRVGIEATTDLSLPNSFGVAPSTLKYREECAP